MDAKERRDRIRKVREALETAHMHRATATTAHVDAQRSVGEDDVPADPRLVSVLQSGLQSHDQISTAVSDLIPLVESIIAFQDELAAQEERLSGMYKRVQVLVDTAEGHAQDASSIKASMITTNEAFGSVYQQMRETLSEMQKLRDELKERVEGGRL